MSTAKLRQITDSPRKRGPKKPHSGMFKKGPDPRRFKHDEERRRARMTIEELAKEIAPNALETLTELLNSQSEKVRLEAVAQVLDRAYGRAVDRIAVQQVGQGNGQSVQSMGLDELINHANQLLVTHGVTDTHEALIDGECVRIEHPSEHDDE